jgi:hypothetical protein
MSREKTLPIERHPVNSLIMFAALKNCDLLCFQLRNELYAQLDHSLKKQIDRLTADIKTMLLSQAPVQHQPSEILEQLFNLRVKAIKWLAHDQSFNYLDMLSDVSMQFKAVGNSKKMAVLKDNILFALRCNRRVVESFLHTGSLSESPDYDLRLLPDVSYQQFLASLAFGVPDEETAQNIADWTNASLHIEFVMLAASIIMDEKLDVTDSQIHDLSFLIADAAQEYTALATVFGILKLKSSHPYPIDQDLEISVVNEQKGLADLGLEDFETHFTGKP